MNLSTHSHGKVLVVDDSRLTCHALEGAFAEAGWDVATTDNPMLVPTLLRKERPDVLVLDVDMPAVQGDDMVTILRKGSTGRQMLIILHSARSPAALEARAKRCGADGFTTKTEGPAALVQCVGALLLGRDATRLQA